MPYVVEVSGPLPDDLEPVLEVIAAAFDISPERAQRLIARAPGPITRPVPEREARAVANVVEAAGLVVEVHEVPESGADDAPSPGVRDEGATADDHGAAHERDDEASDAHPATVAESGEEAPAAATEDSATTQPNAGRDVAPVPDARQARVTAAPEETPAVRRRSRGAIVAVAVVPTVLAVILALAAVVLLLYPTWRADAHEGAQREARIAAELLGSTLDAAMAAAPNAAGAAVTGPSSELGSLDAMTALGGPVARLAAALEPRGYALLLVTDLEGERVAGWPTPRSVAPTLADAATALVRGDPVASEPPPWRLGTLVSVPSSRRVAVEGALIELAAQPIASSRGTRGYVVIGAPGGAPDARLTVALQVTLGAGLVVILLALALAAGAGRRTAPGHVGP